MRTRCPAAWFSLVSSESDRKREQARSIARSSALRMRRAAASADGLVTSRAPNVPKAEKFAQTSSGTERMEVMADLAGVIVAAAVTGYPPDGVGPLDLVGAGVGLGAGAGGDDGGARVGVGFGAELDWLGAGELAVPPGEGAERELADVEAAGWVELRADAEGDGPAVRVPADVAAALAPFPVDDVVLDVVPATLCAAVLENRVVSPNAVITLSSVARHVSRDRRRSPLSRLALRLRCLMGDTPAGLRLRAHQDRASGLLSQAPCRLGRREHERQNADCPGRAQAHRSDRERPARVGQVIDQ